MTFSNDITSSRPNDQLRIYVTVAGLSALPTTESQELRSAAHASRSSLYIAIASETACLNTVLRVRKKVISRNIIMQLHQRCPVALLVVVLTISSFIEYPVAQQSIGKLL